MESSGMPEDLPLPNDPRLLDLSTLSGVRAEWPTRAEDWQAKQRR